MPVRFGFVVVMVVKRRVVPTNSPQFLDSLDLGLGLAAFGGLLQTLSGAAAAFPFPLV